MLPQWIIEKKRDGGALTAADMGFFVGGYARGAIPNYQMSALLMAIAIRGMTLQETIFLTRAMLASGIIIDLSSVRRPKIDKHSTGGVGDKISLVLAPLVACCNVAVPMIVGRGLGITGGTLDKLESIPGFRTRLGESEFRKIVQKCGCAIIGASERLAPADRKMYALRDVSGSVESIPLITASILSKKLAVGLDGIVFDVKCGKGAFMKDFSSAKKLAQTLVKASNLMKLQAKALITDMNQPLGTAVGNALEVDEAVMTLKGNGPADVLELTLALGTRMLLMSGRFKEKAAARSALLEKIKTGEAFEKFKLMVRLQGGNPGCLDRAPGIMRPAAVKELRASSTGYVHEIDAELIGRASLAIGAGRSRVEEKIDHAAGICCLKKIGDTVSRGEPLALLYANSRKRLELARPLARQAFKVGSDGVNQPKMIISEIT